MFCQPVAFKIQSMSIDWRQFGDEDVEDVIDMIVRDPHLSPPSERRAGIPGPALTEAESPHSGSRGEQPYAETPSPPQPAQVTSPFGGG